MSAGQTRQIQLALEGRTIHQYSEQLEGRTIHQYSEQLSGFWRRNKDLEDGGMATADGGGPEDDEEEEQRRQRRRRRRQKVVNCCKKFAAFLFSHIGLATMVVAYSIMGGFLFRELEAPAELLVKIRITEFKDDKIDDIWRLAVELKANEVRFDEIKVNELKADEVRVKGNFTANVRRILTEFQEEVRKAVKDQGWDGKDATDESPLQWSFAGALLYAVTVITTIGYGHVAPKTNLGRMLTIVYALIGIPLTFLYLSNIGNFMADCFRLFYKRICCDVLCCQQCNRKKKRERLRLRRRREMAAQLNVILGVQGPLPFPFLPSVDDPCLRGKQNQTYRNPVFASDHDRTPSTETLGLEPSWRQYPGPPESPEVTDGGPLTSVSVDSRTSREDLNSHDRRFHSSGGDASSSGILETAIIDDDDDDDVYSVGLARETAILHDESETSMDRGRTGGKRSSVKKRSDDGACARETDRLIEKCARNGEFQRKNNALQKHPYYHSDSQLHANHVPRKTGRGQETGGGIRGRGRGGAVGGGLRGERGHNGGESKNNQRQNSTKLNDARTGPSVRATGRGPADEVEIPPVGVKRRAFQTWNRWRHRNKSGPTPSTADQPETKRNPVQHSMSFNLPSKRKPQGALLERSRTTRRRTDEGKTPDERWTWGRRRPNLSIKRAHSAESIQPRPGRSLIDERRGSEESFVTAPSYTFSTDRSDDNDSEGHRDDDDSLKAAQFTLSRSEPDLSRPLSSVIGPFRRGDAAAVKYSNAFSMRFMDDPFDYEAEEKSDEKVTVPISICLVVIGGYIVAGSALFTIWEGWDYLTGSYFCFITLSTIGFGDIVPGTDMKKWASHEKLVLCALWLAFGLSLLAMCFNLMQEEVKDKCKWIGLKLGILNDDNQP